MKKTFFLVLIFFTNPIFLEAQWNTINTGTTNNLFSVYFIDSKKGFVAGDKGSLLKTLDGGDNWSFQITGTTARSSKIIFVNSQTGYVLFQEFGGYVLKTINGGLKWDTLHKITGSNEIFNDLYFLDSINVWIAGTAVYFSSDAGNSWQKISNNLSQETQLTAIKMFDLQKGIALGYDHLPSGNFSGFISKTTDGGKNWTYIMNDISPHALSFQNNIGFAVGGSSIVYQTVDYGDTWTAITLPFQGQGSFEINDVFVSDDIEYFLVGRHVSLPTIEGIIFHTKDGGGSWEQKYTTNTMNSAFFLNSKMGWLVGNGGAVVKYQLPYVSIDYPKGGEKLIVGSSALIEWSSYSVNSINIEYTTNNGVTWYPITSSYPASNASYLWLVPNTISNDCKIKITATNTPTVFDISNNTFSISNTTKINEEINLKTFFLSENYPNPFNPSTMIEYQIPTRAFVSIKLFNSIGQEIKILVAEEKMPGNYQVLFDGSDLISGVYFYQMRVNDFVETKKLVLIK